MKARMLGLALMAASLGGCDALLTEPAPAVSEVSVQFAKTDELTLFGAAAAFQRVDRVYLRLTRPDNASRDTVLRLVRADGVARARLALESPERVEALGVFAELRFQDRALFDGQRVVRVETGVPTSVEIDISPIPAALHATPGTLEVAVGDTVRMGSALLFATGDTITTDVGVWASENPQVAVVSAQGLVLGRAPGTTRLLVRYEGLADTVDVRVTGGG